MRQQTQSPRWLLLLLGVGILLYLGTGVVPMIYCHYVGRETVAIVTSTRTDMEGGVGTDPSHEARYYTLTFDGHQVEKRTSGKRRVGDQLRVIYLANDPDTVVRGSRADGLWRTIENSTHERNLVLATGFGAFFVIYAAKTPARKKALGRIEAPNSHA